MWKTTRTLGVSRKGKARDIHLKWVCDSRGFQLRRWRESPLTIAALTTRTYSSTTTTTTPPPIIQIQNATFYANHPSSAPNDKNPPLFPNLTLTLPSSSTPPQHWALLSPSSTIRTTFLRLLRGDLICVPPQSRTYPYLLTPEISSKHPSLRNPDVAISYVHFLPTRSPHESFSYLSARYESRVETTDFTLERYLTGIEGLNPGEEMVREKMPDREVMERVVRDLELEALWGRPLGQLSNGQRRRAGIARALCRRPALEVLGLDAPFIGLDPFVAQHISNVLYKLAEANKPRIVLALRPQDPIPEWITHIVYAGEDGVVAAQGPKEEVFKYLKEEYQRAEQSFVGGQGEEKELDPKLVEIREVGRHLSERGDFEVDAPTSTASGPLLSRDGFEKYDTSPTPLGEPVVEMQGVRIRYGSTSVLGDWTQTIDGTPKPGLWWTVRRGQRWGIFGANGSGKTTLLSLVTSDHPQTYSAPVRIFQRSRLPEPGKPGITIFDIQARMGHASPEVHALFPKHLSIRRTLESAWADTPITPPRLDDEAVRRVDACLRWFEPELNPGYIYTKQGSSSTRSDLSWSDIPLFGALPTSTQRLLLFLRATIRNPDTVILDEAFSGMDDLVRDKCLLFLSRGETMSLHYTEAGVRPVESELSKKGEVVLRGLEDRQALLVVSHARSEIPGCVREWVCLPEGGRGVPRWGRWDGPVELEGGRWREVWGVER
ncbi:uncharacterized protein EI97DRAFT_482974 [Westerdykella ornata]|uniref:ABC transporter domain-containing protein n=1 Tax=Westerdykella ornata TaxID=318751 RepID=A0A6A6J8Y9_WESOR|nr:uncharacterized protein EI97DRAFT_482974 [Westerdykella ornata]KAF2273041.1 hypothetical protein EI97DRAFT_482974 [Westerdykella ornata]